MEVCGVHMESRRGGLGGPPSDRARLRATRPGYGFYLSRSFAPSPFLYEIVASRFRPRSCWIAGEVPGIGKPSAMRRPRHLVLRSTQRWGGAR